jgi:hypothetical protein
VFRSFEEELKDLGMMWEEVSEAAQDRARWRALATNFEQIFPNTFLEEEIIKMQCDADYARKGIFQCEYA